MSEAFERLRDRAERLRSAGPAGRYAPSPSGPLHLGNVRTALLAWLQARLAGARFILRMDDLDRPRTRAGSAARIIDDLRWLGIDWDEGPDTGGPLGPYRQSERDPLYENAFESLRDAGRLFPCYCSRKDIQQAASAPHGADGAVYPGTCRSAPRPSSPTARPPAWRYRVGDNVILIEDRIVGTIRQQLAEEVGDFVVRRADGLFAYQLATVVDDALMGVTDVLRGADLLSSSPRQIELSKALGLAVPRFWHVPLMLDQQGQRMAKRDGSESIAACRASDMAAPALVGRLAASVGLAEAGEELGAGALLARLDPDTFARALRRASAGPGAPGASVS